MLASYLCGLSLLITSQPGPGHYESEKTWPWLSIPILAVRVSDTDGKRMTPVTAEQVQKGIDFANRTYQPAHVRFVFDPKTDFIELKSTEINSLGVDGKKQIEYDKVAKTWAAQYPGKVVCFYRFGPGQSPTGGCYSGFTGNYVAMCFYFEARPPVLQSVYLVGHEVGHYLGLPHPFAGGYSKFTEALKAYNDGGKKLSVFDGDGLADTAPDPCIGEFSEICDKRSIRFGNDVLYLDRENVMNYTGSRYKTLSRTQCEIVRWTIEHEVNTGGQLPSNVVPKGAYRFVKMKPLKTVGIKLFPAPLPFESGTAKAGGRFDSSAEMGGSVTYAIKVQKTSLYEATFYAFGNRDMGKIQILIDGKPFGRPVDLYLPAGYLPYGPVKLSQPMKISAGSHELTMKIVGRNRRATGNNLTAEALALTPIK